MNWSVSTHFPFLSLGQFGLKNEEGEISPLWTLFPHFHCFLINPRHHCPKPHTCLERREIEQNFKKKMWKYTERKVSSSGWVKCGHLFWVFVNVQRRLSWLWINDVLFDGSASADFRKVSPFFTEREWQKSINLLIIPRLQQFVVCFSQGHWHQQHNKSILPTFVPKRPDALAITQLIQDVFQLICTHLGLASHKADIHRTFFIGWKQSQPPCCRRTAFLFPFQLTLFSFFLPHEIINLQWGEKRNSWCFKKGLSFMISYLYFSIIVWSCLRQLKAWPALLKGCLNLSIQDGTLLRQPRVPGPGSLTPRNCGGNAQGQGLKFFGPKYAHRHFKERD